MKLLDIEEMNTYYGKSHILHDVRLDVYEMTITVLIGRNGAGKTTTLKSIMGIVPPSKGRITFRENNITGWPSYKVARLGVGYVPEGREIFPHLSVGENLTVAQRQYEARSKWDLERIFSYFPRLQERWNQRGRQLSGGEQQMLAIARALITNPELLLLDEPSQGLAPLLIKEVSNAMINLKHEEVTMLLVEQNTKMAEALADHVAIIAKGSIVYKGNKDDYESQKVDLGGKYLSV
jgi:branched-chain amino acid transport system ATP-binding protein